MDIIVIVGDSLSRFRRIALLALASASALAARQGEAILRRRETIPSLADILPKYTLRYKRTEPLPKPARRFNVPKSKKLPTTRKRGMQSAKTMHRGQAMVHHEKRSPARIPGKRRSGRRNGSRK